ncbi:MAG: HAD family hydrolase, partial [Candidatus Dormiibacterota bacterium]
GRTAAARGQHWRVTLAERPIGIGFDYGHTLVDFTRPDAAIAAAGETLAEELDLGSSKWVGTPGEFALALDQLVDQLIDERQRANRWREVDFEELHQLGMHLLLGRWPSDQLSELVGVTVQRAWVEGVAPIEPARAILAQLKEQGIRLALCSNAPFPSRQMHEQLERFQLVGYFDAVLFSSEIGWRKPDPRIFAEMLHRLGLPARSVWFIGDEWEADIKGATAAGIKAILAPGARAPEAGADQLTAWSDLLDRLD